MTCKHCEIDSRKYCPQCSALLKEAQNSARLCDNCGWFGDYTKALSAKKDIPDLIPLKPCVIDWKTFGHCTFTELGNWVHLLTKRAMRSHNSKQVTDDLKEAQNYLTVMQTKLDDIKKNL